jgi:hypothetical protein
MRSHGGWFPTRAKLGGRKPHWDLGTSYQGTEFPLWLEVLRVLAAMSGIQAVVTDVEMPPMMWKLALIHGGMG